MQWKCLKQKDNSKNKTFCRNIKGEIKRLTKCPMPDARCPMPDARCPMPDARCPMPDARCPMPDARCPMPD
ncbi:hypothetical protein [Gilliamella sp. GillExp13]|uniref:hypothetical protein n=1 Tax=Gilliamella sp. GillExp13 TaxID=3120243 RepID=UPI00159EE89B|nr:hypothetical protein [Gilliamella apicola]